MEKWRTWLKSHADPINPVHRAGRTREMGQKVGASDIVMHIIMHTLDLFMSRHVLMYVIC